MPNTTAAMADLCALSNLEYNLAGQTAPSVEGNGAGPVSPSTNATQQPGALQTLTAKLRAEATIELAVTPTATAVP